MCHSDLLSSFDVLRHRVWTDCRFHLGCWQHPGRLSVTAFGFWWDLGNGLLGLVPGLIYPLIQDYKAGKSILLAELFVVLGSAVGMGVAALSEMWVSGADMNTVIFANFLPAFIPDVVNGLVLVPLLMIAYAAVTQRSGRS